jgi:ABC-type nitrate/sulfonate/bicarbonate transport system substrate-binding protein
MAGAALNVVLDAGDATDSLPTLFATNSYSDEDSHITDHLLVPTASEVSSLQQLRGKKIGSFPGSVTTLVGLVFERFDVPRSSINVIPLLPKDWAPALQAGSIDAVVALEPSASQIIKDGIGRSVLAGFYAKLQQDMPISGHWIAPHLSLSDANTAEKIKGILLAYKKAILKCSSDPTSSKRWLVKYAGVREDVVPLVGTNVWRMVPDLDASLIEEYTRLLAEGRGKPFRHSIAISEVK